LDVCPIITAPLEAIRIASLKLPPVALWNVKSAAFVLSPPLPIATPNAAAALLAPLVACCISIAVVELDEIFELTTNPVPCGATVLPMPTFPDASIRILSVLFV